MIGRRVVITGIGAYTPLGLNANELFDNLINGRTVIRNILKEMPLLDKPKQSRVKIGSLFYAEQLTAERLGMGKDAKHRTCHHTKIAFAATKEAVEDSKIFYNNDVKERTGISIGGGFGGITAIEENVIKFDKEGLGDIDRFMAIKTLPDSASAYIGTYYQIHAGDGAGVSSACSSGASNIIYGAMNIQLGFADAWISGGTGDVSYLTIGGFARAGALSLRNNEPEKASRPFDKDRDGFVIGDGAGIVVLEELEHAKARGAKIYAELLGYGARLDGYHATAPREDAEYATQAIKQALKMAKLNAEQIQYINAHGTSTYDNDIAETKAIKNAFGNYAYKISISSTKSMTGHTLNAAGGIEAVVSLLTIDKGIIHPTRNLENRDIENGCDLDYVPGEKRKAIVDYALSNSFAFGGRNVCLIFGKYHVK